MRLRCLTELSNEENEDEKQWSSHFRRERQGQQSAQLAKIDRLIRGSLNHSAKSAAKKPGKPIVSGDEGQDQARTFGSASGSSRCPGSEGQRRRLSLRRTPPLPRAVEPLQRS